MSTELWKSEKLNVRLQGDITNLNNRLNVFDSPACFQGTPSGLPEAMIFAYKQISSAGRYRFRGCRLQTILRGQSALPAANFAEQA